MDTPNQVAANIPPITPVVPASSAPSLNSKKKWVLLICGLLLLIFVGGGAYYLGTKTTQTISYADQKNIQSASSTPLLSPTATITKMDTLSLKISELGINFYYPSELGTAVITPLPTASKITGDWLRVDFDKKGFEPGYYQLSASTPDFEADLSWEGTPHWLNTKILESDTEEIVRQKLLTANYKVIRVDKIKGPNSTNIFKVWNLDCYVGCILSRVYVLPLTSSKYSNLQLYAIIKSLNAGNENATEEAARAIALQQIDTIENDQADYTTMKYLKTQDFILNSLRFGY